MKIQYSTIKTASDYAEKSIFGNLIKNIVNRIMASDKGGKNRQTATTVNMRLPWSIRVMRAIFAEAPLTLELAFLLFAVLAVIP